MKSKYKHIFEPFTIKHMTVKNRIVMTPMGTNYGEQNGEMSFLHINYYEQRAKGGTGLLIVENASVDSPQGSNGTTQLRIDQDNYIPRLFKLCETVHKHGSCIAIQINHAGASAQSARINMQPVSASDVPSKAGGEIPRPLEKDEIMHIVKKYGEAAKRAQIAGFDAVEIHAGHSYLISQFLSPLTNKRTDEFGGSLENRARLAKLVIEEVRRQFRCDAGIMAGTSKPDYANCVDISTKAALKEMVVPGIMAIIAPLAVGLILGPAALGGMLGGALSAGVLLAIMMANAGGAWDNAKKYIEEGHFGGKGSEPHKAAVVGDTVGDPFKDTSGPSINILIKLMTIVAVVFAPLFVQVGGLLHF